MTTSPVSGRSLTIIASIAVLALAACSGEQADTSDGAGSVAQEEQPQLPSTEPGIIYADFPDPVTAVETLRPEQAQVTTPVGTLIIQEVEVVETVPAAAVDVGPKGFEGTARPADGEIFRILNLSFVSDASEVTDNDEQPRAILALRSGGQQIHLSHLVTGQEHRILVSVPDDEEAHLVVSFEGNEQYVDVATGERIDERVEHNI